MSMTSDNPNHSVLIVDESDDSREVLRTILGKRGVRTYEAREQHTGLAIARAHRPNVIVVDVDAPTSDLTVCDELAEQADSDRTSVVLLGSIRRWKGSTPREIVRKPYHFGPLIRKIESLLAELPGIDDATAESKAA